MLFEVTSPRLFRHAEKWLERAWTPVLLVLGCGHLFVVTTILYHACWLPWFQGRAMMEWPSVSCVILESGREEGGEASSAHGVSTLLERRQRYLVRYAFEVDGRRLESDACGPGKNPWLKPAQVDALMARWPAGSNSLCYYDPEDPSRAVLEREAKLPPWWVQVLLLGFLFLGVFLIFIAFKWRGKVMTKMLGNTETARFPRPSRSCGTRSEGGSERQAR